MPKLETSGKGAKLARPAARGSRNVTVVKEDYYGWAVIEPILDDRIWPLCSTPYHGHSKGCKNYCTHIGCPPDLTPLKLRLDRPLWLIWIKFDLGAHIRKMQQRHPEWGERMLVNPLYWQTTSKKMLRDAAKKFQKLHPEVTVLPRNSRTDSYFNVTEMMATVGETLEWPSRKISYEITFAGTPVLDMSDKDWEKLRLKFPSVYKVRERNRPLLEHGLTGLQFGMLSVREFTPKVGWTVVCQQCKTTVLFKSRSELMRSTTCGCVSNTRARHNCMECNGLECKWCKSLRGK